ncbi:MAG: trypsin-like peptidase domain-containing protein [Candidatus Vogelbacteria bacterium]|nr:trypsin-like peptidase domain-containing protein [Candidatus Vogelbacteria bacterium]
MEELNKTQVVLLTLFITFVTSVTTGIITVTLLDQSPPGITQTINRVVERTIERVTPGKTEIKETKVLLTEEDILKDIVVAVKPSLARIFLNSELVSAETVTPITADIGSPVEINNQAALPFARIAARDEVGTGFIVSAEGLVVTSSSVPLDPSVEYLVFVNKKEYSAKVVTSDRDAGFSLLKIDNKDNTKFLLVAFDSAPIYLGQTVFALGNNLDRTTAAIGIVNSVSDSTELSLGSYKTTIKSDDTNIGGPLLNSGGRVIGINLSSGGVVPIKFIKTYMASSTSASR